MGGTMKNVRLTNGEKRHEAKLARLSKLLKRPRSVFFLAEKLDVTERTIYRCLKELVGLRRKPGRDPLFWIEEGR